jgi:hypothetical protein
MIIGGALRNRLQARCRDLIRVVEARVSLLLAFSTIWSG